MAATIPGQGGWMAATSRAPGGWMAATAPIEGGWPDRLVRDARPGVDGAA